MLYYNCAKVWGVAESRVCPAIKRADD